MSAWTAKKAQARLAALADPEQATHALRFFKTGPGEYGEGDQFLGIRIPQLRSVAKEARGMALPDIAVLLRSPWHEERMLALFLLTHAFAVGEEAQREAVFEFYVAHFQWVNNWDLVDASAHLIVGPFLEGHSRAMLANWARSAVLWERRVAVVATFHFIRKGDFTDILALAEILQTDPHDLMHKAVGWMLREVGKRDLACMETFLKKHAATMPRTMLRYAIEKLPEATRQHYLAARRLIRSAESLTPRPADA